LSYDIRPMCREDVLQVTEIDQEAFPTMWPPANYERELKMPLAHYIVARETSPSTGIQPLSNCKHDLNAGKLLPTDKRYLVGFAGLWMMADEAHITNIAVRQSHRRRGIGELLLISMTKLALELGARILTLEVRASNMAAQGLYYKYGFSLVKVRQGYYTDDKEDALVMAIEDITSAAFQKRLSQLKKAHADRWGLAVDHISR
jgi:ribosomal-protein-alanine N-acetyltransferase